MGTFFYNKVSTQQEYEQAIAELEQMQEEAEAEAAEAERQYEKEMRELEDSLDATDDIKVEFPRVTWDGYSTTGPVTVKNTGLKPQSFSVEIAIVDGSTVYDRATVYTGTLRPGESSQETVLFSSNWQDWPDDYHWRVASATGF